MACGSRFHQRRRSGAVLSFGPRTFPEFMRVAFNTLPDSLISQLNNLSAQQNRLQSQAATGQRIQQISDDPVAARRVLDLQANASQLTQFRQNIALLQDQATASYNSIQGLKTISDRAGEIATLADGTKSPDDLKTYAIEITQLIQQGVQLMNSRHEGNYLFGGTNTNQPPYTVTTDANGNVTGVTYQGNDTVPAAEVAEGATVSVAVPGENTSGSGPSGLITDSRTGADFFNHLISLQNHLLAGDTASIASTDRAALLKDENNILYNISSNGLVQSQLNASDSAAASQLTSLKQSISQNADADLAQTLTKLSATQTAYQAALQSGARLFGQSLMDYM